MYKIVCMFMQLFLIIIILLSSFLFCSSTWVLSQFGNLTADEIFFQLSAPLTGTGNGMIGDFIVKCIIIPLMITAVAVVALWFQNDAKKKQIMRAGAFAISFVVLFTSSIRLIAGTRLVSYVSNKREQSGFIEENYADPSKVALHFPKEKKNLIMIYLESMETSYTDRDHGGVMDVDHIPELTYLAAEGEDFGGDSEVLNGGYAMPGCTWTMGGLMASSSGLPLKVLVEDNSMSVADSFFPNIITIGDVLETEGYGNYFVMGSDAAFGGRDTYFNDHGRYEIRDLNYARSSGFIPEDYNEFWGMEDEKMFEMARATVSEAARSGEPFNVTMLTVDTHFPGYECDNCREDFPDEETIYGNTLSCSSRQVSDFVDWLRDQPFYKDTVVVITGDHPTMEKDYIKPPEGYIRKTFTCVLNAGVTPQTTTCRDFATFDLFPTALSAMGVEIEGDRLGLGTDLFSGTPTLSEKYGYLTEASELEKNSDFLASLETLDEDMEAGAMAFSDVVELSVKRKSAKDDSGAKCDRFIVRAPDLSEISDSVYSVQVRISDDNGNKEMRTLTPQTDGSYSIDFTTPTFITTPDNLFSAAGLKRRGTLHFQFFVVIPLSDTTDDYVTVNLGSGGDI